MNLLRMHELFFRMSWKNTISDFNSKLCDIANEAFAFGEKYSDITLMRKIVRSLLEMVVYKVTAIEEDHDVNTMKLDELMGSLQTLELNLKQNKKKSIALRAEEQELDDKGNTNDDPLFC